MKGIVFTEFMSMVEAKFGLDRVDDLIDATHPASGGSYTSVGTYDHEELLAMVKVLSERENIPVPILVEAFGAYLAEVFYAKFPGFFDECPDTQSFLKRIDDHIHVEVRKLYPDAELPVFSFEEPAPRQLTLHYESTRNLADLARGLIKAVARHFEDQVSLTQSDHSDTERTRVTFHLAFGPSAH